MYLVENRETLLQKWIQRTLKRDQGSKKFLSRASFGEFTDPLGFTVKRELEILYDALSGNMEGTHAALDGVLRIQAVQSVDPSEAVSFINYLKEIVRAEMKISKKTEASVWLDLLEFEGRLDLLTLQAFDVYMACREQLFNIKLDEYKRNNFVGFDESLSCSSKTVPDAPRVEFTVYEDRDET